MRLHLFGNCQVGALRAMILEDHPDWSISTTDLTDEAVVAPGSIAQHHRDVAAADVIVSQPVKAWKGTPDLSSDAMEASKRPGAQFITFPSIVFEGTHGAFAYLQHRLSGFGMPYHNVHTVDMFTRSYRHEDVVLLQKSPEVYTAEFVRAGMAASLAELRFREAAHDVTIRISDYFEAEGWSRVLMNSINHPKRAVLANVLNSIYRAVSVPAVAREDGPDYLPDPFIPPLPTVLHHLGLADDAPRFAIGATRYTRDEYIVGSLGYYGRLVRDNLLSALAASRGQALLAAFHGGDVAINFKGQPASAEVRAYAEEWVVNAYQVFFKRSPASWETEHNRDAVLEIGVPVWLTNFAGSDEFRSHHAPRVAAGELTVQPAPATAAPVVQSANDDVEAEVATSAHHPPLKRSSQ